MTWSPVTLAYLAGLIDGEGCLAISMTRGRNQTRRYHAGSLQVANTNTGMIEWLHLHFGGSVSMHMRNTRVTARARPLHVWSVTGLVLERIVRAALPYLVIKRAQAHLILELRKTVLPKWQSGNQKRLAPGVVDIRERLRQRMGQLNKRGVA